MDEMCEAENARVVAALLAAINVFLSAGQGPSIAAQGSAASSMR